MPHQHFYSALNATRPQNVDSTVPQFYGSHSPSMQAGNTSSRTVDPARFPLGNTMHYADGGSRVGGPCCGPPGSQSGLTNYFFEEYPEADGAAVPLTSRYRRLSPRPKVLTLNSPVSYCAAREFIDMNRDTPNEISLAERAKLDLGRQQLLDDMRFESHSNFRNAQSAMSGMAEGASEAIADGFDEAWEQMLELSKTPFLNVGNEATGSPCSSSQPIKTHANAVYLVQKAYREVYLPVAILLLLPGALPTCTKGMISAAVLHNNSDDDAVSPFAGILRSLIAVFLIPATQLIVSYSIDVGNSLQHEVSKNINYGNLFQYGDEQIFRAPSDSFTARALPPSSVRVLGKLAQGPEDQAQLFNQDPASVMLQMLANSMADGAAFGLVILCAFQMAIACYLFLVGPIAAAFYAWPGSTGSLFTRVFSVWLDAIINISLWRFWWCIVLLVMDTRLGWIGASLEMYSLWELLMFISFLVLYGCSLQSI